MKTTTQSNSNILQAFRFRPINQFLWQELELGQLFAAAPEKLNDPFDCRADPLAAIARAEKNVTDTAHLGILAEIRESFDRHDPRAKDVGAICFSEDMNSGLMWSHYAKGHSGVCLMYSIDSEEFAKRYSYEKNPDFYLAGMTTLEYQDDALTDWLTGGEFDEPIHGQPIVNTAAKMLSSKSQEWSYEQEFRILMNREGLVTLPENSIIQVAFGLRTSSQVQELITSAVKRRNPNAAFCKAVPHSERDFGLHFEDL